MLSRRNELFDRPRGLLFGVEPGIIKLQKYPLGPTVIVRVGGVYFAGPIITEADFSELAFEPTDVLSCRNGWMEPCFDRELFGRQSEGIPSHWMEDVKTFHPLVSSDDVGRGVPFQMADVKTFTARIWEHVEHVELRFPGIKSRLIRIWRLKGFAGQPMLLPFRFEFSKGKLFSSLAHWYYLVQIQFGLPVRGAVVFR